jgi:hypothetical protein
MLSLFRDLNTTEGAQPLAVRVLGYSAIVIDFCQVAL